MEVSLTDISKHFAGVHALRSVSFSIRSGSIHGLVGENGAGKSTLGRLIGGIMRPSDGSVAFDGDATPVLSPRDAIARGIAIVQQELALVPELTVADNVYLGREPTGAGFLRSRKMLDDFQALCEEFGFDLDGRKKVGTLSIADQQQVEILKAISHNAKLIVLDEPTSSLSPSEVEGMHRVVKRMARDAGTTFIYVSHYLEHVLAICDEITVLRNGEHIQTTSAKNETPESIATAMLGREMSEIYPEKPPAKPDRRVLLSVDNLSAPPHFDSISLEVRQGEIVGLAGLVGSGRSELLRAIFGADEIQGGTVLVGGESVSIRSPKDTMGIGIAMVPESRREQGLFLDKSIAENIALINFTDARPMGLISPWREKPGVEEWIGKLGIKCASRHAAVSSLSGGNQQKVLFAKWLARNPKLLILDEPTRGVDIGAKSEIYRLIAQLAEDGMGILLVSSEIEELVGLCHRVHVMRKGSIVGERSVDELDLEDILNTSLGVAANGQNYNEEHADAVTD